MNNLYKNLLKNYYFIRMNSERNLNQVFIFQFSSL